MQSSSRIQSSKAFTTYKPFDKIEQWKKHGWSNSGKVLQKICLKSTIDKDYLQWSKFWIEFLFRRVSLNKCTSFIYLNILLFMDFSFSRDRFSGFLRFTFSPKKLMIVKLFYWGVWVQLQWYHDVYITFGY